MTEEQRHEAATSADARAPISIAAQGNFFVGGHYVQSGDGQVMAGQMYVQYQIPANRTKPYPIVMIHGGGATGQFYYETPDGREGWATYFLRQGYAVYVVDQAGRGRSGYFSGAYGETRKPDPKTMMQRFTAPEATEIYPHAHLHTQWPGGGKVGDQVFDQFFASQVEDMKDRPRMEAINRLTVAALLDKIGPSILLVHSQSGPIGWCAGDDRPDAVKLIVALEPNGPPFHELTQIGAPDWAKEDPGLMRPYGVTQSPLAYDPPLASPEELKPVRQGQADGPDLVKAWLQPEPARKLPNLAKIPVLILTGGASYHTQYDHCTVKYLEQAGVKVTFIRLTDVGIHGNGHYFMIEKNSQQIAEFLNGWMEKNVR